MLGTQQNERSRCFSYPIITRFHADGDIKTVKELFDSECADLRRHVSNAQAGPDDDLNAVAE